MTLPLPFVPEAAQVWSVARLNAAVKQLIEREMGPLWVRGEVTSFRAYSSGHWYFTLTDGGAQVRCCMWRREAQRAGAPPAEGTEVYALATPGMWEDKGEFRIVVSKLLPTAYTGAEEQALARTRAALARDGLLDPTRKRPLPSLAETIVVVTSRDGAALRDIVHVAQRRWPSVRVLLVPSRVQGIEASLELVWALELVNRVPAEVCIVGRGGGAREDLAIFNDERVCRALAAVRIPTIAAIGHETDLSLCDLVADARAATPSMAAQLAVADRADVVERTEALAARLGSGLKHRSRLVGERLGRLSDRLESAVGDAVTHRRHRLDRLEVQLEALSPQRVLERGYAVPCDASGRVLRHRRDFTPGQAFTLRVSDGDVAARTEEG